MGRTYVRDDGNQFVVSLAIDPIEPDVMYAGTTGGVYRTKNGAESWVKVTEGMVAFDAKMASMAMGVNSLAIEQIIGTTSIVYAVRRKGFSRARTEETIGRRLERRLERVLDSSVPFNSIDLSATISSQGVKKSTDGGITWSLKSSALEATSIRSIQLTPKDTNILYTSAPTAAVIPNG